MTKTLKTGYYRYTDIGFEWYKEFPEEIAASLRAFFSPRSLVDPGHPLSVPGGGIQLIRGTLKSSNETRLLYTSAQVEYARYWVKEMGLTKGETLALPNSSYLITSDQLRAESPEVYTTAEDIKQALKDMTKNNKRLKGIHPDLAGSRELFEKSRNHWLAKKGTWCAIDFEQWERDHTIISEFGYSMIRFGENGEEEEKRGHWTVAGTPENYQYVKGNRYWYCFGTSEELTKSDFRSRILELIDSLIAAPGPLYLVFWGSDTDRNCLASLGAPIPRALPPPPQYLVDEGIYCVDSAYLFMALEGMKNTKALGRACMLLGVKNVERLHNAGNDAHYTYLALRSMLDGKPLDAQRDERWPPSKPLGPGERRGLEREPVPEDDPDFDGTEDIL